jgi:hypothetical protein
MDTTETPAKEPAQTGSTLPSILNADQVAVLLGCTKEWVGTLCDRNELPGTKYGRRWIFSSRKLMASLEERIEREMAERTVRLSQMQPKPPTELETFIKVHTHQPARGRGRPRNPLPFPATEAY